MEYIHGKDLRTIQNHLADKAKEVMEMPMARRE